MRIGVLYFFTYMILSVCKGQGFNNRLLDTFVNDPDFCKHVIINCNTRCDSIFIIDTLNYFDRKDKIYFPNKVVQLLDAVPFDSAHSKADRLLSTRCQLVITKVVKSGNRFTVNYYQRFSNGVGFIEYKRKKKGYAKIKSQFGQL
jgi:hypothetical protein